VIKHQGSPPRHQDTKKTKTGSLAVLLGIACGDTRDGKKLGGLGALVVKGFPFALNLYR
jgi:hypothetical protein